MQVIYKYPIDPIPDQVLTVHGGIRFLDIAVQRGQVCIWVLKEKESDWPRDLRIRIIGTGHNIPDEILLEWHYWKTLHMLEGSLVLHVFVNMPHLIGRK